MIFDWIYYNGRCYFAPNELLTNIDLQAPKSLKIATSFKKFGMVYKYIKCIKSRIEKEWKKVSMSSTLEGKILLSIKPSFFYVILINADI